MADFENAVLRRLKRDPIPFAHLAKQLNKSAGATAPAVRTALLALEEQGKAAIDYGHGWRLA